MLWITYFTYFTKRVVHRHRTRKTIVFYLFDNVQRASAKANGWSVVYKKVDNRWFCSRYSINVKRNVHAVVGEKSHGKEARGQSEAIVAG